MDHVIALSYEQITRTCNSTLWLLHSHLLACLTILIQAVIQATSRYSVLLCGEKRFIKPQVSTSSHWLGWYLHTWRQLPRISQSIVGIYIYIYIYIIDRKDIARFPTEILRIDAVIHCYVNGRLLDIQIYSSIRLQSHHLSKSTCPTSYENGDEQKMDLIFKTFVMWFIELHYLIMIV